MNPVRLLAIWLGGPPSLPRFAKLVAGSNRGQEKPPAWVGNLFAASEATVEFKAGETTVVPVRVEGAEREQLWAIMQRTWPNYAKYAERTDREIAVFRLAPR